jgi:hypothetical protein
MDPNLRAAENDRQQVIDALQRHTADGRLSLDEFTERVDAVNRSRTYGQLAAVTVDLPDQPAVGRTTRRPALTPVAITAALLVVLLGAALLASVAGWGHMNAMMASMGAAFDCR